MAKSSTKPKGDQPVPGFPIRFEWQTNEWLELFDKQIELIRSDILRARADDRLVIYLSCPISSRGGGYHGTNVDVAKHAQRRVMSQWGRRFWILNPAQYQLESKEGTGLVDQHAAALGISPVRLEELKTDPALQPRGGDYMRMWTKILVEDGAANLGEYFDAYYFLGPNDYHAFFSEGGATSLTAGIEEYFARQFAMNPDFRDHYSRPGIEWGDGWADGVSAKICDERRAARDDWEAARKDFFRFYAVRASANFSKGCHDEWNIFHRTNVLRLKEWGDVGRLLAGYFDGRQIDPGAAVTPIAEGYAL